ncbi:U7 snRNA-associated Sm-like protein LSm10 [Octopus bimaculoides]|uniref:Sm domain-containing protein n=1 Tax=Octopus bimaculoides TaxID=37653 RepID=A0A0L8G4N7_OCTBM|nr:U7 snRNA-associated Sm-like protein LSm10 [Octopus bimaculoides]|eukprot:XP_014784225.1 PREDICTED: U7 snRNA-associated Sm-like protein LSm10 [Octopus bimaculoides]
MATSSRETALIKNSLIILLQAIVGKQTTVDLRNENSVEGLLLHVDAFMNLTLEDVRYISANDKVGDKYFDKLFIQGREVRFVHIPDDVDIISSISQQLNLKKDYQMKRAKEMNRIVKSKMKRKEREFRRQEKKGLT